MAAIRCVFNAVSISQGQGTYCLFRKAKLLPLVLKNNISNSSKWASNNQPEDPMENSMEQTQSSSSVNNPSFHSNDDYSLKFDPSLVNSLFQDVKGDLPLSDMPDPFVKNYHRCFLCKQNVQLDHKNVRLLSQFVSPYTGRIYGRAVTGLCIPMQKHVARLIKRSRQSGYMPFIIKDPKYLQDPQAFDPMARRRN